MRDRMFLLASLALNAALVVALVAAFSTTKPTVRRVTRVVREPTSLTNIVRTNVVVTQQATLDWNSIEASDYAAYIANLRAIGCPAETIRDIIVADVNTLFAKRRTELRSKQDIQWWRAQKDPETALTEEKQFTALDTERRDLLSRLLGPDWDAAEKAQQREENSVVLTGSVLGALSAETKAAVREITERGAKLQEEYTAAAEKGGKPVDEAEIWKLRRQTRDELAKVLTPAQLEEYLLRYSQVATNIRDELGYLSATPEEFRAIFRARDAFDMQIHTDYAGDDQVKQQARAQLEQQREIALKQALGVQRYEEYKLNQDAGYRDTYGALQSVGAPVEQTRTVFQINQASQQEIEHIRAQQGLDEERQKSLIAAAEQDRDKTLRGLLGDDIFNRYQTEREHSAAQVLIDDATMNSAVRVNGLKLWNTTFLRRFYLDTTGTLPPPKPPQ